MSRTYKNFDRKYSTHIENTIAKNTNSDQRSTREDILIQKQPKEFVTVMQNEFNSGYLNPLHTPVLTQYLNIDTRFRENVYTTSASNFTFTLPATIKKVVSMKLTSYELPLAIYGISSSSGNNFLNISCTYKYPGLDQNTSSITIIIEDGNYAALDLLSKINSKLRPLNSASGGLNDIDLTSPISIFNCIQFSVDINQNGSGNGKVTVAPSDVVGFIFSSSIISIELDFTKNINGVNDTLSIINKIGWNIGFTKATYLGKNRYVSEALPETTSMRYIYLVVNDFNNSVNNTFIGAFNNSIINNNILARIPINSPYFNIMIENELSQHTEPRKYFGPVDIQRIQLQLLDNHGRILDLNNSNYSICLAFKTLYD
jgi:hypothetical protein